MNRSDLQILSRLRFQEAKILLDNGFYAGAYYIAGYSVECAIKSCIARNTKKYEFPEKNVVNKMYTHNLQELINAAGLGIKLEDKLKNNSQFEQYWATVKDWTEQSRYLSRQQKEAEDLYIAISDKKNGVLKWIKIYW